MTKYFEATSQAGRGRNHYHPQSQPRCYYFGLDSQGSVFRVPVLAPLVVSGNPRKSTQEMSAKNQLGEKESVKREIKKRGKVHDCYINAHLPARPPKAPKAIDEDLYKIPPDILHRKKKILSGDYWSRCLGLKCAC